MKVNKIDLNFNYDKDKPNPKAPTSIDKNNQFKMKDNKKDLNFNSDKNKPKAPTSIGKKNQINDKKRLVQNEIDKKKKNINSGQGPKFDPNRFMDKGKKKFNINNNTEEQNKKEDKNKEMQAQEENQYKAIFINSINEIRLPVLLYDISYDILQNNCILKISRHIVVAKKHNKNADLEKYYKDRFPSEFDYLVEVIDEDKFHWVRLIECNELCRYGDIRPYEDNYVPIKSGHKFINASWIHIPTAYYFIATQGPLQTTIEDFFIMCKEYDVQLIIMLCNIEEDGKEKCAKYWDVKGLKYFDVGKRTETTSIDEGLFLRKLKIRDLRDKQYIGKDIDQIQFICWDDHDGLTYEYFDKIIKMINLLDEYKKDKHDSPIVIHCSAGVGRTGTFIGMYNLYHEILEQILDKKVLEIKFSIMNLVRKIKEMRMYSIENEYQYNALYLFANYLLFKYNG